MRPVLRFVDKYNISCNLCGKIFQEVACLWTHNIWWRWSWIQKNIFGTGLAKLFVCPVLWSADNYDISCDLCGIIFQEAAHLRTHNIWWRWSWIQRDVSGTALARLFVCPVLWSAEDRGGAPQHHLPRLLHSPTDSISISIFINTSGGIIIILHFWQKLTIYVSGTFL